MHEKKFKGAAAGNDAQFMAIVTSTVANLWGTRGTSCTEPETLSIICANTVRRLAGRENTAGGPHRTDSMTAMSLMGGEDQMGRWKRLRTNNMTDLAGLFGEMRSLTEEETKNFVTGEDREKAQEAIDPERKGAAAKEVKKRQGAADRWKARVPAEENESQGGHTIRPACTDHRVTHIHGHNLDPKSERYIKNEETTRRETSRFGDIAAHHVADVIAGQTKPTHLPDINIPPGLTHSTVLIGGIRVTHDKGIEELLTATSLRHSASTGTRYELRTVREAQEAGDTPPRISSWNTPSQEDPQTTHSPGPSRSVVASLAGLPATCPTPKVRRTASWSACAGPGHTPPHTGRTYAPHTEDWGTPPQRNADPYTRGRLAWPATHGSTRKHN